MAIAAGGSAQGPDNTGLHVLSVSVSIRAGALQRIFIAGMVGLADPIAIAVRDEVRIKVISLPARRPVQGDIPHLGSPGAAAVGETRRAMYRQHGYRVRYAIVVALVNELVGVVDDKILFCIIGRYGRVDLLCLDELGCFELDRRGVELLF